MANTISLNQITPGMFLMFDEHYSTIGLVASVEPTTDGGGYRVSMKGSDGTSFRLLVWPDEYPLIEVLEEPAHQAD